ncbi:metal-dependent hydrolase [Nonlabens sp. Asnod3-A02]|uniref:metal-dependent hydrolase n=1 Tax=Nonlabens sp. Asnod3-A02 TaxID=3160579 RepID=UPI0038676B9F
MDIISHTFTGIAVGTLSATVSNSSWKNKGLIILIGALGGALPDIDAISLWSKFDSTIGSFLGLSHSGREIYFGKFWYSHHAFMHSLITPILIILLISITKTIIRREFKINKILKRIKKNRFLNLAFFLGFLCHLLEDMPTPSSVWSGVNLFFPSSNYIGGFGNIWWWNNYDLVLIIIGVILLNLTINLIPAHYHKIKVRSCISVFVFGITLFLIQINTRTTDFSYNGHTNNYYNYELQSKNIQRDILGENLFEIMTNIDNKIPLNF